MFFVAIVSTFFVTKSSGHFDAYDRYINEWLPTAIPRILWLNTAVLFLSSVTIEIARRRMFHQFDVMEEWFGLGKPTSKRAFPWVMGTIVLGVAFLAGQTVAWRQLAHEHVYLKSNPSNHFFLSDYLYPCIPPDFRNRRVDQRGDWAVCFAADRESPDSGGLRGVVLAFDGDTLAISVRTVGFLSVKR